METWFWLFVAYKFIGATCPFTSKVGGLLSLVAMIASYIFIVLAFFFAPHWWHGLLLVAVMFFIPLLTPRINPDCCGDTFRGCICDYFTSGTYLGFVNVPFLIRHIIK